MAKRVVMVAALGMGLAVMGASALLSVDEARCQAPCAGECISDDDCPEDCVCAPYVERCREEPF